MPLRVCNYFALYQVVLSVAGNPRRHLALRIEEHSDIGMLGYDLDLRPLQLVLKRGKRP